MSAVTVQTQGQAAKKAILTSDPASGGYRFRAEVAVAEGSNEITVSATDLDNETTTEQMTFNAAPVTREFEYDANGNMTADKSGGVVQRSFTWDGKNRLKSVTVGSNTWSWEYDYLDRRRKERLNGTEVKRFVWADTDIVQERSSTNAITRTHYFGGFVVISGTKKYLTTSDHLGHTREVIAANAAAGTVGSVQARYDYNAYQGPNKVSGTTVDATFLTIGRYYHHEGSGLELALYRAYDPELGRWMGEDPIKERGGINLYGANSNEPLLNIDLIGLATIAPMDVYSTDTLNSLRGTKSGKCLIKAIEDINGGHVKIRDDGGPGGHGMSPHYFNATNLIILNSKKRYIYRAVLPNGGTSDIDGSAEQILMHELYHAYEDLIGRFVPNKKTKSPCGGTRAPDLAESNAMDAENALLTEQGRPPRRNYQDAWFR
jgi:RHS repeat-associated protein